MGISQDVVRSLAPASLIGKIAAGARQHPLDAAVTAGTLTVTHGELWTQATSLAESLWARGVRPGHAVGVCLPRSPGLVVAVVGVAIAGAVAVMVDPALPDERRRFMLTDSGARAVIGESGVDAWGEPHGDPQRSATADPVEAADLDAPADHRLAYIVYTSGSTGRPKGVAVEHRSLANLVAWHTRAVELTPADRTSMLASPGFDASVWEIWPTLAAGACLDVAPASVTQDPWALRDWLVSSEISIAFVPTPLAEVVVGLPWPSSAPLRVMLTGGDRLHRRPPAGLPFVLVNNYGVSEATVVSTSGAVAPGDGVPSIGAAIDGVDLLVVDHALRPVPAGQVGELLVQGVSLARGYVGAQRQAASGFVDDLDTTPEPGPRGRAYRTGDLVRQRPDGAYDYLGRIDDQVQLRGVRIEPGEVVAVLRSHHAVLAAAVLARTEDASLTAFLVTTPGAVVADDDLRAHLAASLPAAMVPTAFVRVRELPTNLSGKVDTAALLALAAAAPAGAVSGPGPTATTAPRTDLQDAVAGVVTELLGVDDVGLDDDFFVLGGHSLLGAQLIMRLSTDFDVEVSLRTVFESPTVAGLAAEVERLMVEQIASMSEESLLAAADRAGRRSDAAPGSGGPA